MAMYPVIKIPGTGIQMLSHTLMLALAIVVAAWLGWRWTIHEGLDPRRIGWSLLLIALITLTGGHLHFVLANWQLYASDPWPAVFLSLGALHAPGAVIAAVLGGAVVLRTFHLSPGLFVDGLAPAAGVGIAIARLGCFLAGCCFGGICHLPWGTFLPGTFIYNYQVSVHLIASNAQRSLPIHPLQVYFAGAGIAIAALLLWWRRRKRYDGELGALFLVLFSASSAVLELLRAHEGRYSYWGSLPELLWITMAMTVASVLVLLVAEHRYRVRTWITDAADLAQVVWDQALARPGTYAPPESGYSGIPLRPSIRAVWVRGHP